MFGSYSFLVYMLFFTLVPTAILWLKYHRVLKKNIKIIAIMIILALIFQFVSDPFAEAWHAWYYTREKTLGIWILNFPIENTIFTILIAIVISSAVISFIHYHEQRSIKK